MKFRLLTLGITLGAMALTGSAVAAPPESAQALTIAHSWKIEQDNLLRQFSRGLGIDFPDRSNVVASAGRHGGDAGRERGLKRANANLTGR